MTLAGDDVPSVDYMWIIGRKLGVYHAVEYRLNYIGGRPQPTGLTMSAESKPAISAVLRNLGLEPAPEHILTRSTRECGFDVWWEPLRPVPCGA